MAAKVKWDRNAWWIFTHHNRKRTKKRIGPTKAHNKEWSLRYTRAVQIVG